MMISALISQNARIIKDKDNLRGVPKIKEWSCVKSLKIKGGKGGSFNRYTIYIDMIWPRH